MSPSRTRSRDPRELLPLKPIELLVQSDDYFRTLPVPYYDGPRIPHLVRATGAADTLSSVLAAHR